MHIRLNLGQSTCAYIFCYYTTLRISNEIGFFPFIRFTEVMSKVRKVSEQVFVLGVRGITKLPNSAQSSKGKVKTHKYINRQNQSTTGKLGKL